MWRGRGDRWRNLGVVIACAIVAAVLLVRSPLRLVGDGPEYLAMADRLSRLDGPSLTTDDARRLGLEYRELRTADGRQVLPHFWLYSAVAAPAVAVSRALAANPLAAFTVVNLTLFGLSLGIAARACHPIAVAFLGLGPVLWWLDKAHTEVLAFTLLTGIGIALPRRPSWALLAAGALAAQHPQALAFFVTLAATVVLGLRPDAEAAWPPRRTLAVVTALAATLAASYAGYYLWRIGRWTPLLETGDLRIPALKTVGAVIWDLNIGLIANAPLVAVTTVLAAVIVARLPGRPMRGVWIWPLLSLPLLGAFAQTMNVNHGGTPNMSRYALWLVPLCAPAVDAAARAGSATQRRLLAGLVALSAAWNLTYFAPSSGEGFLQPTALADYQWRHYPGLIDPLPEIFAERVRHQESANTFAAQDGCAKALLQSGQWPVPCAPDQAPIPEPCRPDGILCYANRIAGGYDFRVVTRRGGISLSW